MAIIQEKQREVKTIFLMYTTLEKVITFPGHGSDIQRKVLAVFEHLQYEEQRLHKENEIK